MELIADGVLVFAAAAAAIYCMVLSRRLRKLTQTDGGLGDAIAAMSAQVDQMNAALSAAKAASEEGATALRAEREAAEALREELRALTAVASPAASAPAPQSPPPTSNQSSQVVTEVKAAPPPDVLALKETPVRRSAPNADPAPARRPKRELDGIVSAYLKSHRGQDEATIARQLVAALTESGRVGSKTQ